MRGSTILVAAVCALAALCGPAWAGGRVVIELTDGSKIEGELLRRDAKVIYLSIGDEVLAVSMEKVKDFQALSAEAAEDVVRIGLYRAGSGSAKSVQALAEELGPAIVVVRTPAGLATGWFCNRDGYVVTNHHVVANERSITVTAFRREDGRFEKEVFKKVKLIALDAHMDLALLKIEDEIEMEIPQLDIGDSAELKEGDSVFTIGNPMGLERSTSLGIVSKVNRNYDGRLYVQTTAPIAPGNSGGALFNERGQVIGVTNMGYIFLDGLGFAVPSVYVKEFLDNVDAFAYDPDNPNAGVKYMETPLVATDKSLEFTECDFIKVGNGVSCLTLADVDGDGLEEVVFVNNNKGEIGILRRRREGEAPDTLVDFEDMNRIPDSQRFKLVTHPVTNSISSLVIEDLNGDGRADILFYGDVDSLAVLEGQEDGSFGPPRRIADVDVADRRDALRVADLNGDGRKEIFALGIKEFNVVDEAQERRAFPLSASYRDKITEHRLIDVNGDGWLDLVLFSADKFHATHVFVQNDEGDFVEEELVLSHLSGPVKPYDPGGDGLRFLTLDKGQNRLRELALAEEKRPAQQGRIDPSIRAVALESAAGSAEDFEAADLDGDGDLEIVTAARAKNEFLILNARGEHFTINRAPAPRSISGLKLFQTADGRAVLFSFSQEDKIFGVSRVENSGVTFPRPISTEGLVQFLWLGDIGAGETALLWVEKLDGDYAVKTASAAELAEKAFDGGAGSISVAAQTLQFGPQADDLKAVLRQKPARLAFADFNGDDETDLVMYWSYSGKESLYLGLGGGRFRSIIVDQQFLEHEEAQPLLVADIDGDGDNEVLLVQTGFVRVLKVDANEKLYVERQFNWKFDEVTRLIAYPSQAAPRFVALAEGAAKVVEFDLEGAQFRLVARVDLAGLEAQDMKAGDVDGDGTVDLILLGGNVVQILLDRDERRVVKSRNVYDAKLDHFAYWNIRPADLDADGRDEVLLFDSKKAMFEIHRPAEDGTLRPVCRHRLFEKSISQRGESDTHELPQELEIGDVDGNGAADLIFILYDRIAIYLQGKAA